MSAPEGISVVIPNYNGERLFQETLPTVFTALDNTHLDYEIIIADDCSTDSSIAFLQRNFPSVKTVSTDKNSGFSVSSNTGMKAARYNLVLLLNNDVKLEAGYFAHQLPYFNRNDTFGVMGRIIGWDNDMIQDGAKYPSFHGAKIKTSTNYIMEEETDMKNGLFTMYLSGANVILDRKKFLLLGGFNELFTPFYVEDYELSLRAWRYGWKCYYEHNAVCRHKISTTINSKNRKLFIKTIYNRNKMFLHAIHLSVGKRKLWMLQLIAEVVIQGIFKPYYLKAFLLFMKNYSKVKASRREWEARTEGKKLLSVFKVAGFIRSSIENRNVRFFS